MHNIEDTLLRHKMLVKLAVTVGVQSYLTEHSEDRAVIWNVAHTARLTLEDGKIDITKVVPLVISKLQDMPGLSPDVRMLLQSLVEVVTAEVQMYINEAKIPVDAVPVLVSEVLKWVEDATVLPSTVLKMKGGK